MGLNINGIAVLMAIAFTSDKSGKVLYEMSTGFNVSEFIIYELL
jgi:hypothetical protein